MTVIKQTGFFWGGAGCSLETGNILSSQMKTTQTLSWGGGGGLGTSFAVQLEAWIPTQPIRISAKGKMVLIIVFFPHREKKQKILDIRKNVKDAIVVRAFLFVCLFCGCSLKHCRQKFTPLPLYLLRNAQISV